MPMAPPAPPPTTAPLSPTGTPPASPGTALQTNTLSVSVGVNADYHKVVICGKGGSGKSSLISHLNDVGESVLFLDVDDETAYLNVSRIRIDTWDELRSILHDDSCLNGFSVIAIDSLTKAEDMAAAWVLANIKHEKGHTCKNLEEYGWGKGFTHVYETFLLLLADLDRIHRLGKHIVCTTHECETMVPNPTGEDYLQFQPRLQSPGKGKASIRHRVKEWCGHLFFIGYDIQVNKEGKGTGVGTRCIYPTETPAWWAKSRRIEDPLPYPKGDATLWKQLLRKGN